MSDFSTLYNGDSLEILKTLPDASVALVLTDPPYNIGKASWDKIPNYIDWCISWLTECQRILKPNGVLYLWHNDMEQIARLLVAIEERTNLALQSFCIWDKGENWRANSWKNRDPEGASALRSWFSTCEYCMHFFNAAEDGAWKHTGLDRINSNPECYKPLKEWLQAEMDRLQITNDDIKKAYTAATGKKPYMLRHYFQNSQFEIPTQKVWETVYMPLGFSKTYEELRKEYEELRNVHTCDPEHRNLWRVASLGSAATQRIHVCQKPLEILERLVRVSSLPGDTVLDCFMGSGSTGVAAYNMGRKFIGIERDPKQYAKAAAWIKENEDKPEQMDLFAMGGDLTRHQRATARRCGPFNLSRSVHTRHNKTAVN